MIDERISSADSAVAEASTGSGSACAAVGRGRMALTTAPNAFRDQAEYDVVAEYLPGRRRPITARAFALAPRAPTFVSLAAVSLLIRDDVLAYQRRNTRRRAASDLPVRRSSTVPGSSCTCATASIAPGLRVPKAPPACQFQNCATPPFLAARYSERISTSDSRATIEGWKGRGWIMPHHHGDRIGVSSPEHGRQSACMYCSGVVAG